jgi:hypothetical protein
MTELAVSPLRYWWKWLSPDRPEDEPTPAMIFGSALHCAVLEGDEEFESRYACAFDEAGCPDALGTIEEIRSWIRDKGAEPKGNKKSVVIACARKIDPEVPIIDEMKARHYAQTEGRQILTIEQWKNLTGCVQALKAEPRLMTILKEGRAEVPMSAYDPDTQVLLKCKCDWVTPKVTVDLKTFTVKEGKSVDEAVSDAIFYRKYHRQGYIYTEIRDIAEGMLNGAPWQRDYVMAFVESEPPHEVRLKVLRGKTAGQPNLYWLQARNEANSLMRLYADCVEQFGYDNPWRIARNIDPLVDEDIRQLAWSA